VDNITIARLLQGQADLLQQKGKNLYRVRSFRRAAGLVRMHPRSLEEIYQQLGREGLESMPGIGSHLAVLLERLLRTGEWRPLNDDADIVEIRQTLLGLPGVGVRLVEQLQDAGIDTLTELDEAIEDGRVERLGVGPKRLQALRDVLRVRLNRQDGETRVSA